MAVYKKELRTLGGYLTDSSKVHKLHMLHQLLLLASYFGLYVTIFPVIIAFFQPNLSSVERFIQAVGSYEDNIFQKRARLHQVWPVLGLPWFCV